MLSDKIALIMTLVKRKMSVLPTDTDLVFLHPFILDYISSEYRDSQLVGMTDGGAKPYLSELFNFYATSILFSG